MTEIETPAAPRALPADDVGEIRNRLVNKFLAWRLPDSVCSDLCVTNREYEFLRIGTNLLSADEAGQMVDEVFGPELSGLRQHNARLTAALARAEAVYVQRCEDIARAERELAEERAKGEPPDGPR